MRIHEIDTLDLPQLAPYRTLRQTQPWIEQRWFVAEGEKVVSRLLAHPRLETVSLLLEPAWWEQLQPRLPAARGPEEVYIGSRDLLSRIVGYHLFQGILALGRTPPPPTLQQILGETAAPRIVVALDGLTNAENLGSIVRSAAAFGACAILNGENGPPLWLRRVVRGSMGAIFELSVVQSALLATDLRELRAAGFRCVAAHPHGASVQLHDMDLRGDLCLVFGSEGNGLRPEVLGACDTSACIPMPPGIDSLNAAAAAAAFLYAAAAGRR